MRVGNIGCIIRVYCIVYRDYAQSRRRNIPHTPDSVTFFIRVRGALQNIIYNSMVYIPTSHFFFFFYSRRPIVPVAESVMSPITEVMQGFHASAIASLAGSFSNRSSIKSVSTSLTTCRLLYTSNDTSTIHYIHTYNYAL